MGIHFYFKAAFSEETCFWLTVLCVEVFIKTERPEPALVPGVNREVEFACSTFSKAHEDHLPASPSGLALHLSPGLPAAARFAFLSDLHS